MRINIKHKVKLTHKFVEYIPDDIRDGTIYVSIAFATVVHKCCCGCGKEVVTPLSPTDWKLIFDGQSISLDPSIGNWNFACQSHYWIKHNMVKWTPKWSKEKIYNGRKHDSLAKARYFSNTNTSETHAKVSIVRKKGVGKPGKSFWQKLKKWLF